MGTGLIPDDEAKVAIAPASGTVDPAFDKTLRDSVTSRPFLRTGNMTAG